VAITRAEKEALVEEYTQVLGASRAIFLANYTGLGVSEMERVRGALRQEETHLEVLRNTLFALAARKAGAKTLAAALQGPTLAVFCKGDPTSPAKTLSNLARELEELKVYGGVLGDMLISVVEFEALANLPGREELLASVIGFLQSPMRGFVNVLSELLRKLLYVLQARADQLEERISAEAS